MSYQRRHKPLATGLLATLTLLSSACETDRWVRPAHQGNLTELTDAVNRDRVAQGFDRAKLRHLAQRVAEREIASATDPNALMPEETVPLDKMSDCAAALRSPLERRAQRDDDTAGAARLSLLKGGIPVSPGEWQRLSGSPHGWQRAVAARASNPPSRWRYREQALGDPDARVRQNALLSCIEAPAEDHRATLTALLRAAPDGISRQHAAKALGILGTDSTYRALTDAWPRADSELRLAIVNAYAQQATFDSGGAEQLVRLARSASGIVGVAAAASLALGHSQFRLHGVSRITRALEAGSIDEQRLAISAADWALPEQSEQLVRLGLKADPLVRVAALERWLERTYHVWMAVTYLRELSEPAEPHALLARDILASRKDWSVASLLHAQQRYASFETRTQAAAALLHLGDESAVASSLVDDSPHVRLTTACWVLAGH